MAELKRLSQVNWHDACALICRLGGLNFKEHQLTNLEYFGFKVYEFKCAQRNITITINLYTDLTIEIPIKHQNMSGCSLSFSVFGSIKVQFNVTGRIQDIIYCTVSRFTETMQNAQQGTKTGVFTQTHSIRGLVALIYTQTAHACVRIAE